jgi:hypothetical protein
MHILCGPMGGPNEPRWPPQKSALGTGGRGSRARKVGNQRGLHEALDDKLIAGFMLLRPIKLQGG